MGTVIKPEQISLMFTLIFTPLLFTGCTYYPWGALCKIRWFQAFTLLNPLTYAAEGLRYSMVPSMPGQDFPHNQPAVDSAGLGDFRSGHFHGRQKQLPQARGDLAR